MDDKFPAHHRVSLSDVSKAARISVATVSRAFSHPERVNDDTLRTIYRVAEEIGYVPRKGSAYAHDESSKLIAVVINDVGNPVYAEFVKSIQQQCRKYGYSIMIIDSQEMSSIERIMLGLMEAYVTGVILVSSRLSDANIKKMAKIKSLVLINRAVQGIKSVIADTRTGLEQAVHELRSLGHESLTYLSGPTDSWQNMVRKETLVSICRQNDIALNCIPCSAPTYNGGFACLPQFSQHATSAVIAYNDIMAIGFMTALEKCGMEVPEKVSVVGIDDIPISGIVNPTLSTIHIDRATIGKMAVDELVSRLRGGNLHRLLKPIMLDSRFIARGSTGPRRD
ncbi:LacI family DNA-binding transcriptional regulator [Bifidobacterium longum subsp. infantis]|uniref:LacI family DNA-binding transcriptional regulator n=1 Tax=Bifidobacterium longum TaxID=216816 RepID=UPI001879CE41|nr:LacI family DNA-binding transcriptional regulator [Bifidobacterium longum]QOL45338.1 LacI family DNA-binding transcriptional regulator [Bifidobacterium longum subsp. infantis]